MRPHAPLIALVLAAAPLIGQAQILTRPLSGAQAAEFDRCMKAAGDDKAAARKCVQATIDGETGRPVESQPPAVPATPPPTETQPTPTPPPSEPVPPPLPPSEPATTPSTEPVTPDAPPPTEIPPTDVPPTSTEPGTTAQGEPTQAERDFDAIYGPEFADPTLPAPAPTPQVYDPWERYNRGMHRFNNAVDRTVARPLARGYVKVVPRPFRLGVSNFFNNLGQPVSAINALLQGKPKQAGQSLGRFLLNSTLGIAGIFDPASDAKLPNKSEDFGQTLGVWGWKRSRFVELPLFGPRTLRDSFGMVGDAPLSPLRQVEADRVRIPLQGLQLVDVRAQLLATDSFREGAEDDYALVRDAWMQRRDYQIFGDRMNADDADNLPDYLQDDTNPQVPVDAMPVMPTDGG
ncbi:MlaA family lipoprotein [Lysobacter auxotrophicus]|uniref:VacJ family lipoprotein n=1 Tax=Lysobacter auxotrophicus TaxID=2992573 RepID=A0ABN6UFG3_9GAMM|nr:VacJ family lipoprotein [Lysobacter auxotrophicus]BDU14847.1 VacJ family lipoprotein [Lysobacter auxotrophicus]